jgi:uncharacterized protein (TIGR02284 family)
MDKEKSIEVLNTLVEINNDRIAGYETAFKETTESDLKNLFSDLMQTSKNCKSELVAEVLKLGGKPEEGTKTTGKLYRVFMDFRAALTGKDRKAILKSCEFGEDVAVETYEKVLEDNSEDISSEQEAMIKAQFELIKAGHDKVKSLRDVLVKE